MQKSNLITFNQRVTNIWCFCWLALVAVGVGIVLGCVSHVNDGIPVWDAVRNGIKTAILLGAVTICLTLAFEFRAMRRYLNDSAGSRR